MFSSSKSSMSTERSTQTGSSTRRFFNKGEPDGRNVILRSVSNAELFVKQKSTDFKFSESRRTQAASLELQNFSFMS